MNSFYGLLGLFNRFSYLSFLMYFSLFVTAVFLGLVSIILPVKFVIAFLMIPLFIILALKFTEYAVLLLLLILLGAIPSSYLPQVTIAGGTLRASDVGLVSLFILLSIKRLSSHQSNAVSVATFLKPYIIPLGGLLFVAVLSAIIALLYKTASLIDIVVEARPYLTWLLLPILFMAINSASKFNVFKKMILLSVVLLSLKVVFESFSGISLSAGGLGMRELWTSGQGSFQSVNRVTTTGIFLICAVLMYFISVYVTENRSTKNIFLSLLLMSILVLAILVSFGRGVWLSVLLTLVLLGLFKGNKKYLGLVFWMGIGMFMLIFILYLVKPAYVDAAASRFFSVSHEIKQGSSLERRFVENQYALKKIVAYPVLGVGLGGHFKPPGPEFISWPEEVRYIHNTYINIATKLGLFGLFFALFFVALLFQRTYQAYKRKPSHFPIIFAVFYVFLATTVVTAFTQPNLTSNSGIVSLVIAIFFIESIYNDELS